MKLIVDNQKEIKIGSFNENVDEFGVHFNGIYLVSVGDNTEFPTVDVSESQTFTSIRAIYDNNIEIPLQGNYSKFESINISYDDVSNNYIISYHIS